LYLLRLDQLAKQSTKIWLIAATFRRVVVQGIVYSSIELGQGRLGRRSGSKRGSWSFAFAEGQSAERLFLLLWGGCGSSICHCAK